MALSRVAVVLAIGLPLVASAAPAGASEIRLPSAASVRSGFDDLWSWLSGQHAPSPKVPVQQSGTAAGRPHEVSAAATRAGHGTGRAPGKGKGQLPAYRVLPRKVMAGLSGPGTRPGPRPRTGFDAKSSRRIAAKSTQTSDFYQNTDGSITEKFAEGPVNFRDASGAWQPIDTTLVRTKGGGWHEKANSLTVSFAPSGGSPDLTTVGLSRSESVTSGLAGAAAARPAVAGSQITYAGVLPSTDLIAQPTATGMAESLVLHSASAPSSWMYPLRLKGLRPVLAADGSVYLTGANGKTDAVIAASYAYESKIDPKSGEPAATHAVTYRLTTLDGAPALAVTLDSAWLRNPARVFPVTVGAPAAEQPAPVAYAGPASGTAHAAEQTISIGSRDPGKSDAGSFLRFPASRLDGSKSTVSSVSLSMFDLSSGGTVTVP